MDCSEIAKMVWALVDGELGAKDRTRLEAHLAQCPACSKHLAEAKALKSLLAQAERFPAPPALSAKVMRQIDPRTSRAFTCRTLLSSFAEAAAILLVVAAGILSGGMLMTATKAKGTVVAASVSLESLETLPQDSLAKSYVSITEGRP